MIYCAPPRTQATSRSPAPLGLKSLQHKSSKNLRCNSVLWFCCVNEWKNLYLYISRLRSNIKMCFSPIICEFPSHFNFASVNPYIKAVFFQHHPKQNLSSSVEMEELIFLLSPNKLYADIYLYFLNCYAFSDFLVGCTCTLCHRLVISMFS